MTGHDRIIAALGGKPPDKVPIMLHNFMMAARENDLTMAEFRRSADAVSESFIRAVEVYEYDGILVDIDTATLAGALGVPVDFPDDAPARCMKPMLESIDSVENLPPVDISSYPAVKVWLGAVEKLRRHFGDNILVRASCDQCAFSLASMVRGMENWFIDLMYPERHEAVFQLLDYCHQATRQFLRLMAESGAHMLSNGDSPAGPDLISPDMYRRFAFPWEKDAAELAAQFGLPYALHICGDTSLILEDMVKTGADGLELDYKTDAEKAHTIMKEKTTLFGNLDPSGLLALGSVDEVAAMTRKIVDLFADTPRFVLNAGCALPATTPSENIQAMIAEARRAVPPPSA